ncbi:hypothetical protein C8F04DRAFT_1093543 [Mycena alexandri]|uniref:Secreted protein n=1 Tax=Mycena alexandri TaxID=1745969 RepID=A0AAD6T4G2_9AGAR|nr:hypothetical protein C8F04DRAFT_1093543 [Mycena alexandri]
MRGWSRTWVKFALMVGYRTWLDGALAKVKSPFPLGSTLNTGWRGMMTFSASTGTLGKYAPEGYPSWNCPLMMLICLPATSGLHLPARSCIAIAVVPELARRREVRREATESILNSVADESSQ